MANCRFDISIRYIGTICRNASYRKRGMTVRWAAGRCHAWDEEFSLSELKARLDGAEWYDDQAFAEYGLSAEQITDLRGWAQASADGYPPADQRRDLRGIGSGAPFAVRVDLEFCHPDRENGLPSAMAARALRQ
jgi:hypothetical protein